MMIAQPPTNRPVTLPDPEPEALAVSARLRELIDMRIDAHGGHLPFAEYMNLALYAPGLGYYAAGSRKFGRDGDFVTAPELGSGLAQCLARQIVQVFELTGVANIIECGAGTGVLAAQILSQLENLNSLPDSYQILEVSTDLIDRQRTTIANAVPGLIDRVRWLDALPNTIQGVVVANELLDAMPVARFNVGEAGIQNEVTVMGSQRTGSQLACEWYQSDFVSAQAESWHDMIAALDLPMGYQSEVNAQAQAWVSSVAERLTLGAMILIDYGFPQHEFYHPQRSGGTLMCHYRHHADANPYVRVGMQDITAHVDFTAVATQAHNAGLTIYGYTQQAPFLMSLGLMESAQATMSQANADAVRLGTEIKLLTLPSEMGELFKVLIAGRGIDQELSGFAMKNDLHRL